MLAERTLTLIFRLRVRLALTVCAGPRSCSRPRLSQPVELAVPQFAAQRWAADCHRRAKSGAKLCSYSACTSVTDRSSAAPNALCAQARRLWAREQQRGVLTKIWRAPQQSACTKLFSKGCPHCSSRRAHNTQFRAGARMVTQQCVNVNARLEARLAPVMFFAYVGGSDTRPCHPAHGIKRKVHVKRKKGGGVLWHQDSAHHIAWRMGCCCTL